MTVSMWGELLFLLRSLLFGVALGVLYSLLRISRLFLGVRYPGGVGGLSKVRLPLLGDKTAMRFLKRKREGLLFLPVLLGDLLFFLLFAIGYSVFLYAFHSGVFRLYSLLGVALGFFLCEKTVGRLVLRFSLFILFGLYAVWDYAVYFLFAPLFRVLGRLLRLLLGIGKTFLRLCGHSLYSVVNTLYDPLRLFRQRKKLQKLLNGIPVYEKNEG